MEPWHGCEQFHSQPDGTAGVNADGDLTHSPDYPTASQTCARLVPERLLLHATLTISPSIATAGRHHRSCVDTSRRLHPHLLESGQARSPSLAHHPWCQRHGPSLRWIRAKLEPRWNLHLRVDEGRTHGYKQHYPILKDAWGLQAGVISSVGRLRGRICHFSPPGALSATAASTAPWEYQCG